jgi:peptidoglycan/xylan/chitin deacetylase (PgdA/CDA1 family)
VHNIYDSYEDNVANIKECEDWIKEKLGVKTTGFVAPRGIWNNSLEQALVSLNYDYSSDFGFVMHGLPYRPYMNNEKSKLLQVPVNAYNVGRAEIYYTGKIDYLSDEMILDYYFSYFNDVMSEKGSGLIHIFGHPHGLGKRPELLESIYKYIKTNDILAISIREFVDWWKYREESNYELNFEKGKYVVEFTNNPLNYSMSLND